MPEHHEGPIKTPKQLIITVLLAFLVPVLLMIMLSQWVTGDKKIAKENEQAVAERIKPVGSLVLAGPKIVLTGEQVYNTVCTACHGSGLAGAPKTGDKSVWGKLLKEGKEQLTKTAISGIRGMPARGGNPELSDQEVEAAVVFMANQAGANWQAGGSTAPKVAALDTNVNAAAKNAHPGLATYDKACAACHAQGVAGAPKTGDKLAWAPRIKTGINTLYNSAIKGKGTMLPKGGNPALADAEVKAAVDYLVSTIK